jgi:hypothetical protein
LDRREFEAAEIIVYDLQHASAPLSALRLRSACWYSTQDNIPCFGLDAVL